MEFLITVLQRLLRPLHPVLLIPAVIIFIVLYKRNKEYKSGAYYQVTKLPYRSVRYNTGRYGEYLTYMRLRHLEADGARFLFNVYIPKGNGEMTEIDVLMICPKGIFVFESKNYSGWIFGSESQKNWYQTLPAGRGRSHKEHFYNPVMQNRTHIKHLKFYLEDNVPTWSVIVFSDRCTLKSIQLKSDDIRVIKRCSVAPVVSAICSQTSVDLLSESAISDIYNKLYPFTQVDEVTKAQHIANIQTNLNNSPVHRTPPGDKPSEDTVLAADPLEVDPADDSTGVNAETPPVIVQTPDPAPVEPGFAAPPVLKCPWCNGNLVLRTATRGANAGNPFYGCSCYPKCRYIQNVSRKQV